MAFIREIKRGNKRYYYLVETYREDGKVKQRTLKYLGTKRPPRSMPWSGEYVEHTVARMLRPKPVKTTSDHIREADKLAVKLHDKLQQLCQLNAISAEDFAALSLTLGFLMPAIKEFLAKTEAPAPDNRQ